MKIFDTIAELALAKLQNGQFVSTGGNTTKGDGGGETYLVSATGTAQGDITLANANVAVLQRSRFARKFSDITAAIAAKELQDGDSVDLATGTNGAESWDVVDSSGVVDNGFSVRASTGVTGVSLVKRPNSVNELNFTTMQYAGSGKKLLVRRATFTTNIGTKGSRYWAVNPKGGSDEAEYVLIEMRRGFTTSTVSLGAPGELLRVSSIFNLTKAWIGRHDFSAISDVADWTETTFTPSGTTTLFEHGESIGKYWAFSAGSGNKFIEFNVPFDKNGEANIQFLATTGSANDVELTIDGGTAEILNLVTSAVEIYRHKITATPGFHTVRITKPNVVGNLNVFGANYADLYNYPIFKFPAGFVGWGEGTMYTQGEGGSDYAIKEIASGLFGGGFHGGEILLSEKYIVDGIAGDTSANMQIGESIEIRQETQIDWSGSGGGTMNVLTSHSFFENSGYNFTATFKDSINADTFYCAMHTTPDSYDEISTPNYVDVTLEPEGFITLERGRMVTQTDTSTSRRVHTEVAIIDDSNNKFGGPTVDKVTGTYHKFYYGPVVGLANGVVIPPFSSSFRKVFN